MMMFVCDRCGVHAAARRVQGLLGPVDRGLPVGWMSWSEAGQWRHACSKECGSLLLLGDAFFSEREIDATGGVIA